MTQVEPHTDVAALDSDALGEIERQVLWLSTAIVHYANRVRPNPGGLKVGGHQASSASSPPRPIPRRAVPRPTCSASSTTTWAG